MDVLKKLITNRKHDEVLSFQNLLQKSIFERPNDVSKCQIDDVARSLLPEDIDLPAEYMSLIKTKGNGNCL